MREQVKLSFQGQVVLVTGAGRGIGKAIALAFARDGAKVAVNDINPSSCEAVAEEIRSGGGEAAAFHADVSNKLAVQAMLIDLEDRWGRVDVLINNAGIFDMNAIDAMPIEQWQRMIDTVLTGTFYLTSLLAPHMKQQKWGRIVNISSRTGLVGGAKLAHYSAAKAGLIGLTKALAKELGTDGILCNVIAPTTILTPREREKMTPDRLEKLVNQIPLKRVATPDDISRVALFLGSGMNTFVNGEVITVGGGAQS